MRAIGRHNSTVHRLFDDMRSRFATEIAAMKRIRSARQARSVTQRLLTHDDRMLMDMGVSRGDVEQALSVAWSEDPSVALAEIRRRRMQADRQGLVQRRVR